MELFTSHVILGSFCMLLAGVCLLTIYLVFKTNPFKVICIDQRDNYTSSDNTPILVGITLGSLIVPIFSIIFFSVYTGILINRKRKKGECSCFDNLRVTIECHNEGNCCNARFYKPVNEYPEYLKRVFIRIYKKQNPSHKWDVIQANMNKSLSSFIYFPGPLKGTLFNIQKFFEKYGDDKVFCNFFEDDASLFYNKRSEEMINSLLLLLERAKTDGFTEDILEELEELTEINKFIQDEVN